VTTNLLTGLVATLPEGRVVADPDVLVAFSRDRALMRRVKAAFDPAGLLRPGKGF
jgi:FAD/FMN-containing dehydrogenase